MGLSHCGDWMTAL